jgi:small subunit ribosomal protein S20
MANHPSSEKRNRQRTKRTLRNDSVTSTVRTAVKKARAALGGDDKAAASEAVSKASKLLARAASKGILSRGTASRTTSRIQSQLGKLAAS